MPTNSLIKFAGHTTRHNKKLFWERSGVDGLPFRGNFAPIMGEEEYESRVVRVGDPQNAFFDVTDPEQNKGYLMVLDGIANGWFQLIFLDRFHKGSNDHYVEWVEYYMEDGTRTPYQSTGFMGVHNGSTSFANPAVQGQG